MAKATITLSCDTSAIRAVLDAVQRTVREALFRITMERCDKPLDDMGLPRGQRP